MKTALFLFFLVGCVHQPIFVSVVVETNESPPTQVDRNSWLYSGTVYDTDPLAIASSLAADEAYGVLIRTPLGPTKSAPPDDVQALQQDVRAIQRWIGAQEKNP